MKTDSKTGIATCRDSCIERSGAARTPPPWLHVPMPASAIATRHPSGSRLGGRAGRLQAVAAWRRPAGGSTKLRPRANLPRANTERGHSAPPTSRPPDTRQHPLRPQTWPTTRQDARAPPPRLQRRLKESVPETPNSQVVERRSAPRFRASGGKSDQEATVTGSTVSESVPSERSVAASWRSESGGDTGWCFSPPGVTGV